jgi:signal transduction histidine kinase
VWVRVAREGGGVLIVVEDDGPGVPDELKQAVFEPFRQGNGVPYPSPGVGVGLSLVARFAELHGGRAWVEERDGGGASFRVLFGWEPSAAPEPAPAPEELDAAEDQP